MERKQKIIFCFSGGKDSAIALYELQRSPEYEIVALLTTITEDYNRVSMHGLRRALLHRQTESLGYPLEVVMIPKDASSERYESAMAAMLRKYKDAGVRSVAFGDVFGADVRGYRENNLSKVAMTGIFPLWRRETAALARQFIELGFGAVITCVDSKALGKSFLGRNFDESFLKDLPAGVDPCGENGEFHSFVYAGPIFRQPIAFKTGRTVFRKNRFYFCDLLP